MERVTLVVQDHTDTLREGEGEDSSARSTGHLSSCEGGCTLPGWRRHICYLSCCFGGESSLNSCCPSPLLMDESQKMIHGFAEHHQSTSLFLINLMHFYDTWITDVYVFCGGGRGVPDTQGGRGGVEGKGHFSGNEQSSYTPHYNVSEVTRHLQC